MIAYPYQLTRGDPKYRKVRNRYITQWERVKWQQLMNSIKKPALSTRIAKRFVGFVSFSQNQNLKKQNKK